MRLHPGCRFLSTRGRRWDNVRSKIKIFPYRGGRLSPVTKLYGISHVDRLRSQPNVGKLDSIIIDNNGLLLHGTSPTSGDFLGAAVESFRLGALSPCLGGMATLVNSTLSGKSVAAMMHPALPRD